MKKPNKHVTRLVIWTISGSILTSSCVNVAPDLTGEEKVESLSNIGVAAIKIRFSKEQVEYYNYLSELAQKIITDRNFAKEFNKAPSVYLKGDSIGINSSIADKALLRITTALADDDIAKAIENKDIKQYFHLMHQKGLLNNKANDYINLLTIAEKRQLLKSIGIEEISDEQIESAAVAVVVCILYAAVLAVSYVGAAYTALAAVNVGVGISVVYETAVTAKGKDQKPEKETDKDKETEKDKNKQKGDKLKISQNFDVYMLASKDEEEIAFGNDEFARIIDDAMEAFKELYIKDAKAIDLNLLKQTINLNLSKQNSISENITILKR